MRNHPSFSHRVLFVFVLVVILSSLVFSIGQAQIPTPSGTPPANTPWEQALNLSQSGAARQPRIVASSDGRLQVFWLDRFDGLMTAYFNGLTWSAAQKMPLPTQVIDEKTEIPTFIVDVRDRIHAFWYGPSSRTGQRPLYHNLMTFGGFTWSPIVGVAESAPAFSLAALPTGDIAIAYIRNLNSSLAPSGVFAKVIQVAGNRAAVTPTVTVYSSIYYRLLTADTAQLSLASFSNGALALIWRDYRQSDLFFTTSLDNGTRWSPLETIGDGLTSLARPRLAGSADGLLRIWQQGGICVLSQQSLKNLPVVGIPSRPVFLGVTPTPLPPLEWSQPQTIFPDLSVCPEGDQFIWSQASGQFWLWGQGSGVLNLAAWNAERNEWSLPNNFSLRFDDPETGQPVGLDNLRAVVWNQRLAVTGVDPATSEVWVVPTAQEVFTLAFAQASSWSETRRLSQQEARLPSAFEAGPAAMATDQSGRIHIVWSQVAASGSQTYSLYYARWDGQTLTSPVEIVRAGNAANIQPFLLAGADGWLHLAWNSAASGEILYSRASVDQAGSSGGWKPSQKISGPESAAWPQLAQDGDGRLCLAYVAPVNEGRGVYFSYSNDLGDRWGAPELVFDAAQAGWQMVSHPALTAGYDGSLHLAWVQVGLAAGQNPLNIYYTRSPGVDQAWSEPFPLASAGFDWPRLAIAGGQLHFLYYRLSDRSLWHIWNNLQTQTDALTGWSTAQRLSGWQEVVAPYGLAVTGSLAQVEGVQAGLHLSGLDQRNGQILYSSWDGRRWSDRELYNPPPPGDILFAPPFTASTQAVGLSAAAPATGGILALTWQWPASLAGADAARIASPMLFFAHRTIPQLAVQPPPPRPTPTPTPTPEPQPLPTLVPPTATPPLNLEPLPPTAQAPLSPMILGGGLAAVILIAIFAWILLRPSK